MEIRNEYTSFNSNKYHDHTHHITKCLHEESSSQRTQAGGAGLGKGQAQGKTAEFSRDGDVYHMSVPVTVSSSKSGKGKGVLRGLWDALGEEGESKESGRSAMTALKESLLSGIHGAAAALRHSFSRQVIERAKGLRERLRVSAEGGRRFFGRGREAFGTPSDGKASSRKDRQDKESIRLRQMQEQISSPEEQEDIPMRILVSSHLMDSYTKSGEYCQLGENLTYRKEKTGGKVK